MRRRHLLSTFALALCATLWTTQGHALLPVFINEFHYDNIMADTGEFIEIAGPAGTDLSAWSIVLYSGVGGFGTFYDTDVLSGLIPNLENGYGVLAFAYAVNGIQNGATDGIALVNGLTVVQFLSYEGPFLAVDGVAAGMTSTDILVSESGITPVGHSLQLQGTGNNYEDFSWQPTVPATGGLVNFEQSFTAVVPEPGSLILLGGGLLALVRRRRSLRPRRERA